MNGAVVGGAMREEGRAVITVERVMRVGRPRAEVVGYLEDFARTEEWDPGTLRCVRLDDGLVRPGARWLNTSRFRGRTTELRYELVVRDSDRLLFVGENKTVTALDDLRFTEQGTSTLLTYRASLRFKGLARLAAPFLRREFEQLGDGVVTRLPAAAEAWRP
ncbi:SRPBCC family protein [Streptomyces sp. NPDC015130]|uniref:SRPBCC family protein n=1 Tax=Streptomyces sp. NPDC015130 TaxID=3364940 RepID=UPI00370289D3